MHRTDGNAHVSNMFGDGNPAIPTVGTLIEKDWLNMVQEELVAVATDAAVTLVKGTNNQLLTSLRSLFVRAAGNATQTITGIKTFAGRVLMSFAPGASNANLTIDNLDTTNDSNAVKLTSSSVGSTADFRNSSTGAALNAVGTSGYAARFVATLSSPVKSPVTIVPQNNPPSSGTMGDLYVDSTTGKLYIYTTTWTLVGSQT